MNDTLICAQRGRKKTTNTIGWPQRYELRIDGLSSSITHVLKDNYVFTISKSNKKMKYIAQPTKFDLIEYFQPRIKIRKMTEREAMRLMDVSDEDIDKMKQANIAKTRMYALAGNSIVVSCLYHIFRTMFIPNQPEYNQPKQLTLF
jgi:site-specific DNA-cytosine methylase